MPLPAAAIPMISAGIGGLASGLGNAMSGGSSGTLQNLQPTKNAPVWQDAGLGTVAMIQTMLGNPMFASYFNQRPELMEGMFGGSLQDMGISPNMFGGRSNAFGYTGMEPQGGGSGGVIGRGGMTMGGGNVGNMYPAMANPMQQQNYTPNPIALPQTPENEERARGMSGMSADGRKYFGTRETYGQRPINLR